jgi:hypothetical protein
MRHGRGLIGVVAGLGLLAAAARAQTPVAPDDPRLIQRMNQACLSAALTSGGLDKQTRGFCQCAAPIFARHMTADSRSRLVIENRTDVRPDYDDPTATASEILKACPPASP